jgi:8-oxo-dGTP pyrophosphatase MutT (NUDIX family)
MAEDQPQHLPQLAVGLIVAEDGRVLLQHRDDKPDILEPGVWALFGGHVDSGEDLPAAFLREMDEELGWRPKHFELYKSFDLHLPGEHFISNLFAAHLDRPIEELSLNEGQGFALFPPLELPARISTYLPEIFAEFATTDAYRRVRKSWDLVSATAILVDGRGRFLLQHRDDKPEIINPGLWGSFGGAIEDYETPVDGFLREVEEELGWRPATHLFYGAAPYTPQSGAGSDRPNRQLIYVYAAPVDVPFTALTLNEGQGMAFFPPEGLPAATVGAYKDLLLRFAATDLYAQLMSQAA